MALEGDGVVREGHGVGLGVADVHEAHRHQPGRGRAAVEAVVSAATSDAVDLDARHDEARGLQATVAADDAVRARLRDDRRAPGGADDRAGEALDLGPVGARVAGVGP